MSEDDREELVEGGDDSSNQVAWFITGALVGASLAVLFTPKSGKNARQFIADTTQQGKDAVTASGKDIAETSREMFDRGRKVVEDAADLFDRARKLVRG